MEKEAQKLKFNLDRSCRYHQRRRSFFDTLHKTVMLLVVVLGTSAYADVFGQPAILSLFAAIIAGLDLVIGFSMRARDHELLFVRFMDLMAKAESISEPTKEDLEFWIEQRHLIEKDEPPHYQVLNLACYNEVVVARGLKYEDTVPLSLWHRTWKHFFRFSDHEAKSVAEIAAT